MSTRTDFEPELGQKGQGAPTPSGRLPKRSGDYSALMGIAILCWDIVAAIAIVAIDLAQEAIGKIAGRRQSQTKNQYAVRWPAVFRSKR